jgi:hypothetical protein
MKAARLLSLLAFALAAIPAFAQMPETPAEITKLAWAVGDWEGTMKWTMAGMPPGSESKDTWKVEIDGQFIKSTATTDMMGMSMKETSFVGWDAANNRYNGWGFSNWAPTPRIDHGTVNGDVWVMESEPWVVGGEAPTVGRSTVTRKSDTEMTYLLEFKDGDKWNKIAEGTFKKKV